MNRFPVNGSAAQLAAGDVYGIFATLFRDCYYHAEIGAVSDERLLAITSLFGVPWDPSNIVSTVSEEASPRFITQTRLAIPAHNECAYTASPPRLLALYCARNTARGGEFFAVSTVRLLDAIGSEYLPSLRGARFSCRMSADAPPFETTLVRATAAGEQVIFTSVLAMTGASAYCLTGPVDDRSAGTVSRLSEVANDPLNRHGHAWHAGDLIVIDNLRLMHGREAFQGGDRVLRHIRLA